MNLSYSCIICAVLFPSTSLWQGWGPLPPPSMAPPSLSPPTPWGWEASAASQGPCYTVQGRGLSLLGLEVLGEGPTSSTAWGTVGRGQGELQFLRDTQGPQGA